MHIKTSLGEQFNLSTDLSYISTTKKVRSYDSVCRLTARQVLAICIQRSDCTAKISNPENVLYSKQCIELILLTAQTLHF